MIKLQPGDHAPNFTASFIDPALGTESTFTLSEQKQLPVVLYFYPKDNTPGCTKQACDLRDSWEIIRSKAIVLGISPDPIKSHKNFIAKYALPFPLISDPDHQIADSFGVWVEKNLYGRKYMGVERSTFIIGTDGLVKTVLAKVKPDKHSQQILAALDQ